MLRIHLGGAWAAAVVALCVYTRPAAAHSWYEQHCCHQHDCAPATKIEEAPAEQGRWITTAIHGRVFVPYTLTPRPSQDGATHLCAPLASLQPRCVYEGPGM